MTEKRVSLKAIIQRDEKLTGKKSNLSEQALNVLTSEKVYQDDYVAKISDEGEVKFEFIGEEFDTYYLPADDFFKTESRSKADDFNDLVGTHEINIEVVLKNDEKTKININGSRNYAEAYATTLEFCKKNGIDNIYSVTFRSVRGTCKERLSQDELKWNFKIMMFKENISEMIKEKTKKINELEHEYFMWNAAEKIEIELQENEIDEMKGICNRIMDDFWGVNEGGFWEIKENTLKIIISNRPGFVKIKDENVDGFDYELENGEMLHTTEWNGEEYVVKNKDGSEIEYRPIYFEYIDEFDDKVYQIVGFEC